MMKTESITIGMSLIAFEKEYLKRVFELVLKALNLVITLTAPESLLHISVYQNH